MSAEIKIERHRDEYLVFISDHDTGSVTSMGASTELEGINRALALLGSEIAVYTTSGPVSGLTPSDE